MSNFGYSGFKFKPATSSSSKPSESARPQTTGTLQGFVRPQSQSYGANFSRKHATEEE